jgi:signal transduction histidine kinase
MFEAEGQIRQLIIYGTIVAIIFIAIIILFIVFYKNRKKNFAKEKQSLTQEWQRELLTAKIEVQEQTLQHFCTELHDNIGQKLSVARIYINKLEAAKLESTEKEDLTNISTLLGAAINDLRNTANSLNPDYIADWNLSESLQREMTRINQTNFANCSLSIVEGSCDILNKQQELLLFRICQEFIQNSIKHARCSNISASINFKNHVFSMTLKDDGIGFKADELGKENKGSGVKNILNRAKILGAEVDINSTLEIGTSLNLSLEIKN